MLSAIALLAAAALPQPVQPSAPRQVQDLTLAPETVALFAIVEGRGVQIYTCTITEGHFSWTFQAPEAQLFNLATGKPVGHHDAGPTWTLDDGSSIRGTVLAKHPGDTAADVPWLLLQAQPSGSQAAAPGALAHVTFVRRSDTRGGNAPLTGCDAAHQGQTLRVPYVATYSFYGDPQFSPAVSGRTPAPATGVPAQQ